MSQFEVCAGIKCSRANFEMLQISQNDRLNVPLLVVTIVPKSGRLSNPAASLHKLGILLGFSHRPRRDGCEFCLQAQEWSFQPTVRSAGECNGEEQAPAEIDQEPHRSSCLTAQG